MICPKKVQDMCLFGMMCPREAVVDDDGECAAFIRSALALMEAREAAQPDQADPVEAAELQQEREAIQGEMAPPRWIPVVERLPERWRGKDKDRTLINYLVYSPDYGVDVGNYIKTAKMWVIMGLPVKVTHWMPLPEPPKEGQ